jgi:hypothetical protein
LKKPTELDITVLATPGLDMPTKMLALAVEVTEASQREFIMAFDGGGDGTDRLVARRACATARTATTIRDSDPGGQPGRPHSTSGVIRFDHEFRRSCRA